MTPKAKGIKMVQDTKSLNAVSALVLKEKIIKVKKNVNKMEISIDVSVL